MEAKRIFRVVFTLITIVLLFVIGFNIANYTSETDLSVLAQTPIN